MRTALVDRTIDVAGILAEVSSASCGATSLFLGTVREQNEGRTVVGIDYSAYDVMAIKEMDRIVREAAEQFGTERIVMIHRIGFLSLGEVSVAVAAAHARRAPSLDATRYVIEELKKRVPVWKREHYTDGTREWVDPTRTHEEVSP